MLKSGQLIAYYIRFCFSYDYLKKFEYYCQSTRHVNDSEKRSVEAIKKATTRCGHSAGFLHFASFSILIVHRHFEDMKSFCDICLPNGTYATPKVTKYQRCNFIIQIHQFTIKIDKINISLLFESVKIVVFNFNSRVFHVMYQETRFLNQDACFLNQEGRRQFLISFVSERD